MVGGCRVVWCVCEVEVVLNVVFGYDVMLFILEVVK